MSNEKTHILRRGACPEPRPDPSLPCFAAVPRGAEEITAAELERLGIQGAAVVKGGVAFAANRIGLYRANLWLRTASRVLVTLAEFSCSTPGELYQGVHAIAWHDLITPTMTLAEAKLLGGR